ncbi:MAG: excinuclease ABC subunit UvrA [Marinifilaceae bacterium]|jgi:excinuclease ABC subunit A|nr:excinuclease ABC subunit UvrA [Marinifilaceae bacterium]
MSDNKTNYIEIKAARVHNLKNIDLKIPRNKLVVITGLSGSGKSSLAFDTLYAEGQRRYVESLSAYARQFLGKIDKPEVDYIKGIPPAIAIEQKVNTRNPRSTVGTSTEIYDYIKLLFARLGKTYSPISNKELKSHSVGDVVDFYKSLDKGTVVLVMSKLDIELKDISSVLNKLSQQGFSRLEINNQIYRIDQALEEDFKKIDSAYIIIDRLKASQDEDSISRIADSIQTSFYESDGEVILKIGDEYHKFSNKFEADGIKFEQPSLNMFSFNNPIGACKRCEGFGKVIGIDENLVIPNKTLSIYEDAVVCWKGEKMQEWKQQFLLKASKSKFPIHKAYCELNADEKQTLWEGNRYCKGINHFFLYLESKQYKIQYRVMLARYRGKTTCPDCKGTRLKKEAAYVKINGLSIQDIMIKPISELKDLFNSLELKNYDKKLADRLLVEIKSRLNFLSDVGLGYLDLNRLSSTLSGGESQRINIASSLGSSLVGSLYILDEPSIGLHSKDTENLIKVLKQLRDIGNTVVVVEHDEDIILAADQVIDIGPDAGRLGGELRFQGTVNQIKKSDSYTGKYLSERLKIEVPKRRRNSNRYIEIKSANENNLKNIDVKFPLNSLCVVTGVSGSGKSTLVKTVLYPALKKNFGTYTDVSGSFESLEGDLNKITDVEFIDQNPIGKSSRSNPVTYLKAYDDIRKLFAAQQAAKYMGMKPGHFSFNTDGGRCDECQGEGQIKIEMQFMADVYLECEACKGRRFKDDVLDVRYRDKNIHDILEMTIEQAVEFFKQVDENTEKKIVKKLQTLLDVGLGYVKMGQSSSSLSGGESQRVKLASFLAKEKVDPQMFIFDEPTTGLHFHDICKLMNSFNALINRGHSLVIIEHNLDVIKSADWIIDLGKEGGDAGGYIVAEGSPEHIVKNKSSYTAKYLREKL